MTKTQKGLEIIARKWSFLLNFVLSNLTFASEKNSIQKVIRKLRRWKLWSLPSLISNKLALTSRLKYIERQTPMKQVSRTYRLRVVPSDI